MSNNNKNSGVNTLLINKTTEDQFLLFVIEEEEFGIPIEHVNGIVQICPITIVPHTESYIKGIFSIRGDIIPALDVRERFQKPPKEHDYLTCIIDVTYKGYRVGLIVDSVSEVVFIHNENLSTPPNNKHKYHNNFVKNIGKTGEKLKLIIDLEKFLLEK